MGESMAQYGKLHYVSCIMLYACDLYHLSDPFPFPLVNAGTGKEITVTTATALKLSVSLGITILGE